VRTTLDIDNDVLEIARGLASHRKLSVGKVISDLCRKHLRQAGNGKLRNGVRIIQRGKQATPVSLETVNQFRDETI
jgi:hypothetical protein